MCPQRGHVVEQSAQFKEFQIPLAEAVDGPESVSAVLGIPEWWPTCQRIAMVIAHDTDSDLHHPLLEHLQTGTLNPQWHPGRIGHLARVGVQPDMITLLSFYR